MLSKDKWITGRRFGSLTITGEFIIRHRGTSKNKHQARYLQEAVCDCGNTTWVARDRLTSGGTKSCGCARKKTGFTRRITKINPGERWMNPAGYIVITVPWDHRFHDALASKSGQALEHRVVMSEILGRPLQGSETVHHINGDRADNSPENLQLRQGRHAKGVSFVCNDCGSQNVSPTPFKEERQNG